MAVTPSSRRKLAPAVTMLVGLLGALALLVGFVPQTIRDISARTAEPFAVEILADPVFQRGIPEGDSLRPATLRILDRTPDGILSFAAQTHKHALIAGLSGAENTAVATLIDEGGEVTVKTRFENVERPGAYELAVRRTLIGYRHTLLKP